MSFDPTIPLPGLGGLKFLERTYESQFARFAKRPDIKRDIAYFQEKAGEVRTAEELVKDTRLLRVALGAFGLEDEAGKKAFVRKVLESDLTDGASLANRLSDPAWRELSAFLGFGNGIATLNLASTRAELVDRYQKAAFESAVGDVDVDLRLARNFQQKIGEIASSPSVEASGWFRILGSQPLRRVVEGAFNLPEGFGKLDVDLQRSRLEEITRRRYGSESPAVFTDPKVVEDLVRRYVVTAQLQNTQAAAASPASAALTLLQGSGLGVQASTNLFASRLG